MKNITGNKRYILFCIFAAFYSITSAQYNHEIGISGGTSFYLGDANQSTPFHTTDFAYGGFYLYNINTRYALKAQVLVAEIEGDSRDFNYIFPNNQIGYFNRQLVDIGLNLQFNFFDLGQSRYYNSRNMISPYFTIGIGYLAYNNMFVGDNVYKFTIPVGIGGKWKITKRLNLGVEWKINKLFVDDLDVTNNESKILNNPYQTNTISFFDTDWYSAATVSLSYNLFNTRKFCR
ncbi:MAG: hypothetical protein KA397_03775 [Paludibacteraceae bacterium]|nr:hypothetical protein [Paludibacteraceae bacterium]MBP6283823.1 hypothetical protein [Paludibacteraceae bacterium]